MGDLQLAGCKDWDDVVLRGKKKELPPQDVRDSVHHAVAEFASQSGQADVFQLSEYTRKAILVGDATSCDR